MLNTTRFLLGLFVLIVTTSCSQIQKFETQEGFSVTLPQRVYWNSNVTVTVQAPPGTPCNLSYITPAGFLSDADGLGQTISNANGICLWTWNIGEAKRKGAGRLIFRINGISETHFIEVWSTE